MAVVQIQIDSEDANLDQAGFAEGQNAKYGKIREVQITPRFRPKQLEKRTWHLWTTGRQAEQRRDGGDRVGFRTVYIHEAFQDISVGGK